MNAHAGSLLMLSVTAMLVLFRIYVLVHRLWRMPLEHGPRFFWNVEVPEGFYEGPGISWLKRHRAIILTEHLIEAAIIATILGMHRLDLVPVWAGGSAIVFVAMIIGLALWVRHGLDTGANVQTKVAVALEPRRLGAHLSWRMESLSVAIMVLSWAALVTHGDARTQWQPPAVTTYVVLALAASQILIVRNRYPLPAERTEQYYQLSQAQRRYALQVVGLMRWFFLAILASYAMQHSWEPARTVVWLRWLLIGAPVSIWLIQVFVQIRGQGRLTSMGRGLRPLGNLAAPFQSPRLLPRSWLVWVGCFCSGLAMLHLYFKR